MRKVDSLEAGVVDFINFLQTIAHQVDEIKILNPGDGDWEDDEQELPVLDVYVRALIPMR